MSEEECIKELIHWSVVLSARDIGSNKRIAQAIDRILDLYKKEKDRNIQLLNSKIGVDLSYQDYISKDKIIDKMNEIMSYTFSSIEEKHCQEYVYDRFKELLEETENG